MAAYDYRCRTCDTVFTVERGMSEVVRQIPDGGLQRCFGNSHDIVVRHDALGSKVGERHDASALGSLEKREVPA